MATPGTEKLRLKALNIEKGSARVSPQISSQEKMSLTLSNSSLGTFSPVLCFLNASCTSLMFNRGEGFDPYETVMGRNNLV